MCPVSTAPAPRIVRALVFDFDGLIIDTETPEYQAWQEIFTAHGTTLPLQTWVRCIGTADHGWDPYAALEAGSGHQVDRAAVRAERRARIQTLMREQPVRPGVESVLRQAQQLGLRIGLASSSNLEWVSRHLRDYGLLQHFDVLRTSDDVVRTKPDPALYRLAVEALGVRPDEAIAFEDSPNGLAAAKAAGLFRVAVPNPMTRQLNLDDADVVLPSIDAMPLQELLALAGDRLGQADSTEAPLNPELR